MCISGVSFKYDFNPFQSVKTSITMDWRRTNQRLDFNQKFVVDDVVVSTFNMLKELFLANLSPIL